MKKIINTFSNYLDNDYFKDYFKDYLKDQLRWQTGMKEELERLQENHPRIQAVVFAANQAQISDHNPALNKCIWQLRDAIDEADDVLDEFEYMKLKQQLTENTEETKKRKFVSSLMHEIPCKVIKIGKRALKIDPNLKRLEEAVQKLLRVSADVTTFLHLLDSAKQEQKEQEVDFYKARETGSLPTNDLIGRGEAKEFVMQWLRKPSNEHRTSWYSNISFLSIVGHGGMGKTTLLQHVYEDEITKEFDLKMWVCVSNNFDVKKVFADMLESLDEKRPRLDTLNALQKSLKNKVNSKRFLLVLDDVWEEEERDKSKWGNVLAPLASGGLGSKILVTTRTDSVAQMFEKVIQEKKEPLRLEGLEEEECLELLHTHAFAVDNPDDQRKLKLKLITAEIVKKLSGSPLAAKVIGGILNSNLDEGHWRRVLDSVLEIIKSGENVILPILRLSYVHLPERLKSCFTFCSIFPQDYLFDKDDLVRKWNALGFIQLSDIQGETMEDIGGRYFDDLVKKNFFDKFEGFKLYYKMHDLIHELAQSISIHECLRVEDSTKLPSRIPRTLRHLSVETTNADSITKIGQFKYLHSLFLSYEGSIQDLCNALIKIFKASTSLRLIHIYAPEDLKIIPKEIENLIHLRYLKIEADNLTMLPRSLSNLYHLQYIINWGADQPKGDDFLPSDINNLSNLRYVKLHENCISSIRGIGKLNSLQELDMFDLRDVSGYRIGELKNMNDLCKLGINCLENVKDAEEARNAQLCEKRRLTDLTLCWSDTYLTENVCLDDLDENVLDNLQPPECLRNLSIKYYRGARSPIWMNNVNPISNLEKIELNLCWELLTLPPFGQLRFLKSLKLSGMPNVKWLESKFNGNDKYHAFPSLEVLHISLLEALEDWLEAGVAAEDGCLFPCLIELKLFGCPKLKELPSLPSKLKRLEIHDNMEWKTLNFCSNSNPIPLESLEDLTISDPLVLLMEPLISIASLKELRIVGNDELVSFPNEAEQWFLKVRSSLCELQLLYLKSLQSLPSSLESLSSLQTLSIVIVPMLRELPSLPPSLKSLSIEGCHPELFERYREDGGSHRHKIAHIPHIIFY